MEKKNKKEILCNKEMNKFIMDYFYKDNKNNNDLKNIKDGIKDLNIKEDKHNDKNMNNQLDIISILFSLIKFVEKYKNKKLEKDKLKTVDDFIESNKDVLDYYNKYYYLIKDKEEKG
jgi:hypothetical protein